MSLWNRQRQVLAGRSKGLMERNGGGIREVWSEVGQGRGAPRAEGRSWARSRKSALDGEVGGVREKVGLEM